MADYERYRYDQDRSRDRRERERSQGSQDRFGSPRRREDIYGRAADYGHRDAVVFFGYQDPAHFYYVHLGKKADDHANQIFIVNDAPRAKISKTSTDGTNWTDDWHRVRVTRRVSDGRIEIFFDDMQTPVMTAVDKTFAAGRIGLGTFDDTGDWDDVKLYGVKK